MAARSVFSTTVTWNWRGRQITAAPARKVSVIQRAPNVAAGSQQVWRRAREDRRRASPAMPNDHQTPTASERGELDHRLERDRRDDAVVALVDVDVAHAEQDREDRHAGGDPEGDARSRAARLDAGGADRAPGKVMTWKLVGQRLELQRDVGRRPATARSS